MPDAKSRRHGIRFPQCGARGMRITVTGAYGFSGKYMAQRLLDLRHEVITLTNSPHRSNPFGESVKAFLYNFSEPKELEKSLRGIDVLINTYWVRFDKPSHFTFAQALANTKVLFDAAKRVGPRSRRAHQHHQSRPQIRSSLLQCQGGNRGPPQADRRVARHSPAGCAVRQGRYPDQQYRLGPAAFAAVRPLRRRAIS